MKQGLEKVVADGGENILVMNGVRADLSASRKMKRQKLSNEHCEPLLGKDRRSSVQVKPEVTNSVESKKHASERDFCDTSVKNAQAVSSSAWTELNSISPEVEDLFLSRRRLSVTCGEDLSSKLSDELVLIIFRWLPKSTLVRCAFVCKRWRRIAYDESLWSRLDLSSKVLKSGSLAYVLARGVAALRLSQSDIHEPVFSIPSFGNEDGIYNKLQYLDLSMSVITGSNLAELLKTCKCLLKLSIEHCSIIQESGSAIAVNSDLEILNMSMCSGVDEICLKKILSGCSKLLELNLAWTNLQSSTLECLSTGAPDTLTRLNISGCRETLSDDHVHQLVESCPNLVELDLSDCTRLTASCVEHICRLKKLEHVALSRCYNITSSAYLLLSNIGSLLYLDVMGLFTEHSLAHLEQNLPNISLNKFLFSSIARPTVGVRRTSIWGLKLRR